MKQRKQMESFDLFLGKLKAQSKIDYAEGFKPQPPMTEPAE
jgi:hypothetical protein